MNEFISDDGKQQPPADVHIDIEDVSKDGRWVALSVQTRREGLGVDASRYGDPTYVAPALGEFELIDATSDRTR